MRIVDRGARDIRRPRSRWPDDRNWRPHGRIPDTAARRYRPPVATYALAAICIAVFLYGYFTGTSYELIRDYALVPADLKIGTGDAYLSVITHMFLHGSWLHILLNMVVLISFGRALEPSIGAGRFLILYFVSGIAGALGYAALTGFPETAMIGASGAIAGILGAAVVAAPRMLVIFFIIPMPLFVAVILLIAVHIAAIVWHWDPQIAWWVHLVGLAVGALLFPILRPRPAR
jgi:membrane associated rhomboid family serine protease